MKISGKMLTVSFILIAVFSCVLILLFKDIFPLRSTAVISQNGKILYEIDLNAVSESYTVELPGNTVLVEPGRISMLEADCPDKLCIKRGALEGAGIPIICLPNRVVIEMKDSSVDAVSGRAEAR